jgi:hypothetical protein
MAEVRKRVRTDMVLAQKLTGNIAGWGAFAWKSGQACLPGRGAFAHFEIVNDVAWVQERDAGRIGPRWVGECGNGVHASRRAGADGKRVET